MNPRPYTGPADLERIKNLMREGLRQMPYSYLHPGDVEWWLFYNPLGDPPEESVFLWESEDGQCLGWALYLSRFAEFDLWIHPSARGTELEARMLHWVEGQLLPRVSQEQPDLECTSAVDDHGSLHALLQRNGYTRHDFLTMLRFDLTQEVPVAVLPHGYHFLQRMEMAYVEQRAEVHRDAFNGSRMNADYYRAFMTGAPSYRPEQDIVVVAPDGTFAAFAMTWRDDVLRRGEFEPVGTRTSLHRKGLGTAVMWEGLRRLKAAGMVMATVCCHTDRAGTVAFYESCGFEQVNTVSRYNKRVF